MNKKARELGMKHTTFQNACGLDAKGHVTSAYDIALMTRELAQRYPEVFKYTKIWMDTIIHKTKKGEKEFGLSNTNKLIRQWMYRNEDWKYRESRILSKCNCNKK